MLIEPMIQQLHRLRLHGMGGGLEHLLNSAQLQALSFEERLSVMIQHEITNRDSKRLAKRLRWAKLPQSAALEDLATRTPPGIDPKLIATLAAFTWIKQKLNVLITGASPKSSMYSRTEGDQYLGLNHPICGAPRLDRPTCEATRREVCSILMSGLSAARASMNSAGAQGVATTSARVCKVEAGQRAS